MDKTEAIKRLDALDVEAKELRKIIERGDGLTYSKMNLYVATIDRVPYVLAGQECEEYYRWHSFRGTATEQGWSANHKTGQNALDYIQKDYEVKEFKDKIEGMKYFMEKYNR